MDEQSTEQPGRASDPIVIPRGVQLVLLAIGLLAVFAVAHAAGTVLLIFLVAGVIALILNPLVKLLEHRRLPPRAGGLRGVYRIAGGACGPQLPA